MQIKALLMEERAEGIKLGFYLKKGIELGFNCGFTKDLLCSEVRFGDNFRF